MTEEQKRIIVSRLSSDKRNLTLSPVGRYIMERNALEIHDEATRKRIEESNRKIVEARNEILLRKKEIELFSKIHKQHRGKIYG